MLGNFYGHTNKGERDDSAMRNFILIYIIM